MYNSESVERIKKELIQFQGCKLRLKANRGRKRMLEEYGVLENLYANVFTVKIIKKDAALTQRRISYSYSDLLTSNVKLDFFRADHIS